MAGVGKQSGKSTKSRSKVGGAPEHLICWTVPGPWLVHLQWCDEPGPSVTPSSAWWVDPSDGGWIAQACQVPYVGRARGGSRQSQSHVGAGMGAIGTPSDGLIAEVSTPSHGCGGWLQGAGGSVRCPPADGVAVTQSQAGAVVQPEASRARPPRSRPWTPMLRRGRPQEAVQLAVSSIRVASG